MVDTELEDTLNYYHQEIIRHLRLFAFEQSQLRSFIRRDLAQEHIESVRHTMLSEKQAVCHHTTRCINYLNNVMNDAITVRDYELYFDLYPRYTRYSRLLDKYRNILGKEIFGAEFIADEITVPVGVS